MSFWKGKTVLQKKFLVFIQKQGSCPQLAGEVVGSCEGTLKLITKYDLRVSTYKTELTCLFHLNVPRPVSEICSRVLRIYIKLAHYIPCIKYQS